MIENGTVLQDRYQIERKIGMGGMGAVYLAVDKRFENQVAIKETFFQEEYGKAFEREARLLNALQHPVLPHVSDYFTEDGGYFLVMQYIEGADLSGMLKRKETFLPADVLRWTGHLLDALDYLHSQEPPIIHRDIKPHNLKLNQRGEIKLLDFGLAKISKKDATEVSVFGYSRTYSPLEQIQGTGTDARSDIFALGATVYHLLTGDAPVNALTRVSAIVEGKPDPLQLVSEVRPEVSEAVASVINTALALNAQNRFESAKAMLKALEHATLDESRADAAPPAPLAAVLPASAIDAVRNENTPTIEPVFESIAGNGEELPPMVEKLSPDSEIKPKIVTPVVHSRPSPTVVNGRKKATVENEVNHHKILWAAAAVLLFFGIGAAFYFTGESSADQTGQQIRSGNSATVNANRENSAQTRKNAADKSKTDETKTNGEAVKSSDYQNEPAQIESSENPLPKRKNNGSRDKTSVTDEEAATESESDAENTRGNSGQNEETADEEEQIPEVKTEQPEPQRLKPREKRKERPNQNQPDSDDQ